MTNNPPSAQIKPGEYGFPLKLKARYDNFIGGEWVAPADGEYYQNLTPVTGQLLCEVASSGKRDIDLALDAAQLELIYGQLLKKDSRKRKELITSKQCTSHTTRCSFCP